MGIVLIAIIFFLVQRTTTSKKDAMENIQIGNDFLTKNMIKKSVVTTDSGLQLMVLAKGTGDVHPKASDMVEVHYHGTLIDGTVFDSSVDRGKPLVFGLDQVIKGWTEGLQLMVEGEKARLFIPSNLGYGNKSAGSIPAGSVLIFDVELLSIK